jgi:hypothetical protein
MLTGKFHSHLTLDCCPEYVERSRRLVGGKVTVVDLQGGDNQQDVMLTHHFVSGRQGVTDHYSILRQLCDKAGLLATIGVNVLRTKLEFEYQDPHSQPVDMTVLGELALYAEAHVKMRPDLAISSSPLKNWALSFNHDATDVQFFNRRIYRAESPQFLSKIKHSTNVAAFGLALYGEVIEVKIEAAIYDDNPAHDVWWAVT